VHRGGVGDGEGATSGEVGCGQTFDTGAGEGVGDGSDLPDESPPVRLWP
jgi:hypothetical protein